MGLSYKRDESNDDPMAPSRGMVYGSFFGVILWSFLCGIALFFFLNGWSL